MNRALMVAASIDLAAAKTCWRQGPLAWVGAAFEVTQVSAFVPHQQGSGSPPVPWQKPGSTVPGWVGATKHAYRFSAENLVGGIGQEVATHGAPGRS